MNNRTIDASFIQNFTDDPNNIVIASYQIIKHDNFNIIMIALSIMRFLPCVEKLDIVSVGFVDEILVHPKYHNNGVERSMFQKIIEFVKNEIANKFL